MRKQSGEGGDYQYFWGNVDQNCRVWDLRGLNSVKFDQNRFIRFKEKSIFNFSLMTAIPKFRAIKTKNSLHMTKINPHFNFGENLPTCLCFFKVLKDSDGNNFKNTF